MRGGVVSVLLALAGLAAAGVIVFLVVVAFDGGDSDARGDTATGVTLDDITERRGRYLGRTVTVKNRIDEIVSSTTFTLEADPGNTVVVVAARPLEASSAPPVSDGDLVRVTGRVTATDSDEFDASFEAPGEEPRRRFADAPAIIDATVTPTPSRLPSGGAGLTVSELERNPKDHLGSLTSVDATVGEIVAPGAWTIGGDLLALTDLEGADRLDEGERVQLTGVLRRFEPRKLRRESRLDVPDRARRRGDSYVFVVRGIDFEGQPAR